MPRGNGMGPQGMGPMTGRAGGLCAGNGHPGNIHTGAGRGCGFGGGRGGAHQGRGRHGNRNMFLATGLPGWVRAGGGAGPESACGDIEKQALTIQAEALQSQLDVIRKRLAQLETKSGT